MFTFKRLQKACTLTACSLVMLVSTAQEQVKLGQTISEASLAEFDLIAEPGGTGFPPGSGTANQGRTIFENRCALCHGSNGEGNSAATVLVGGNMQSEDSRSGQWGVTGPTPVRCSISSVALCLPMPQNR